MAQRNDDPSPSRARLAAIANRAQTQLGRAAPVASRPFRAEPKPSIVALDDDGDHSYEFDNQTPDDVDAANDAAGQASWRTAGAAKRGPRKSNFNRPFSPQAATRVRAPSTPPTLAPRASATPASARAVAAPPVTLGTIAAPSGTLAVLDLAQLEALHYNTLAPGITSVAVPAGSFTVRGGPRSDSSRSNGRWNWLSVDVRPGDTVTRTQLGVIAIDLHTLALVEPRVLTSWCEDATDGLADVVVSGGDAAALASPRGAALHRDGMAWRNLPLASADTLSAELHAAKRSKRAKSSITIRPHSDWYWADEAAREASLRAGPFTLPTRSAQPAASAHNASRAGWLALDVANGVFPIFADFDATQQLLRLRIEFLKPIITT